MTPAALRHDVRRAAGRIAEVGGWIARDSGDYITAARLTIRAADHLRAAEPALRAMILMRRSNIVVREDPGLAVDLAAPRSKLVDAVVESDDALMEKYLLEGAVSGEELNSVIPKALAAGTYKVSPDKIAHGLIATERALGKLTSER